MTDFLFSYYPASNDKLNIILLSIFGVLLVTGIVLRFEIRKRKKNRHLYRLFRKLPFRILALAIAGLICSGLRFAGIPIITMGIVIVLVTALIIYLLVNSYYQYRTQLPVLMSRENIYHEKNKYLPAKKSGKS